MAVLKTWRETLADLEPGCRDDCVRAATLTHFMAPIPEELAFLDGGLADLGFENLDLPPQEQDKMLLAFVGKGVKVPGTPYRLRSWGLMSFVEVADGSEEATLPETWRQALLVPTREHDKFNWIGKRVKTDLLGKLDLGLYDDVGDGWVPKSGE